ncbi:MAG: hypothetical protein ACOX2F_01460 [bacterium]
MSWKKVFYIGIVLVAVVLVAYLLYHFRPSADFSTALPKKEIKSIDAISELGDLSKSKPVDKSNVAQRKENVEKSEVGEASEGGETKEKEKDKKEVVEEKFKKAGESIADSFKVHGPDAVLKPSDKLDKSEMYHGKYTINEPNFSSLHPLNYQGLKKVYTYFRLKESMPEIVVNKLNGAAVIMTGAVMPVDKIPEDGKFAAFWLSNPTIVLAGCVFCNPPTLADIVYVYKDGGEKPFSFEREKLFKQVVLVRVVGRLFFGPETIGESTFLFSILATDVEVLN